MSASQHFHAVCNASRTKFAQYCSEPRPEDLYVKMRWVMSGAHLMFVEALENIYSRAETIPQSEEQDFAYFTYIAVALIRSHHDFEETFTFPKLEPEFKTNVLDEHAAFHKGLLDLDDYLTAILGVKAGKLSGQVVPDPEKKRLPYDGAKVRRYLDAIVDPLFTHLSHEIDWLAPENIRASGVTTEKLKVVYVAEENHIQNTLDPHSCLVFGFGHIPPYCQFPDIPWFVKHLLSPWVFWWKHRSLWKYFPTWSEDGTPIMKA